MNFNNSTDQPAPETKHYNLPDDPSSIRSLQFQHSETGSSGCYPGMPITAPSPTRVDSLLILSASMESDREILVEDQAAGLQEPCHAVCQAESQKNMDSSEQLPNSSFKAQEPQSTSGDLFRQFVEERVNAADLLQNLEEENIRRMSFNQLSSGEYVLLETNINNTSEDKIDALAKTIIEDIVDDTLTEIQAIGFRKKVCPEDELIQLELIEDLPESGPESPRGKITNHVAISDFLSLLIDFILEGHSEIVVQRYNTGIKVDPAEAIKILRQKEILLYSSQAELENYSSFIADFIGALDAPVALESNLLDDALYCALRSELMESMRDLTVNADILHYQSIFQRAVFDCFNEVITAIWRGDTCIDHVRLITCGKQPLVRYLSSKEELEILLTLAKEHVLDNSLMLCGIIRDKDDSVMAGFGSIDMTIINNIREQRLSRMLNQHVPSIYRGL